MEEFLFMINDLNQDEIKLIKITEASRELAEAKFAKAFSPFLDFDYKEICRMCDSESVEITCIELTDIITL